jgi:hypothetical protein
MANIDLLTESGYDIDANLNNFIPVGAIISYGHGSFLSNVDEIGMVPCDGRSLNTYTYRNLHKVISNIYGGTAYLAGSTDMQSATTTFTIPLLNNSIKFIAMKNAQALNATGGSSSHWHETNPTPSTATVGNSTFDHGHYWTAYATGTGEYHTHALPGYYFGNSGTPANQPVGKVDGNQVAAGRYHAHSGYTPQTSWTHYTVHDHYADGNMYTAVGTSHGHTGTQLAQADQALVASTPEYVAAMFYIKI